VGGGQQQAQQQQAQQQQAQQQQAQQQQAQQQQAQQQQAQQQQAQQKQAQQQEHQLWRWSARCAVQRLCVGLCVAPVCTRLCGDRVLCWLLGVCVFAVVARHVASTRVCGRALALRGHLHVELPPLLLTCTGCCARAICHIRWTD
jgi:flagellar motor protein MotB